MPIRRLEAFGISSHFVQVGKQLFAEGLNLNFNVGFIQASNTSSDPITITVTNRIARTLYLPVPPAAPDTAPPPYVSSRAPKFQHQVLDAWEGEHSMTEHVPVLFHGSSKQKGCERRNHWYRYIHGIS